MNGWERSPEYGGPPVKRWELAGAALVIVLLLAGGVYLAL